MTSHKKEQNISEVVIFTVATETCDVAPNTIKTDNSTCFDELIITVRLSLFFRSNWREPFHEELHR